MALDGLAGWTAFTLLTAVWGYAVMAAGMHRHSVAPTLPLADLLSPFRPGPATPHGALDVAVELRQVLKSCAPVARQHHVQLEQAVARRMMLHADRQALRAVVAGLVRHAVAQVPGGLVLVTAQRRSGGILLAVSDDGDAATLPLRHDALRDVSRLVALQGGALQIETVANPGTAVVVWLPETPRRAPAPMVARTAPPAAATVGVRHSHGAVAP